jgi:hypothetical protein
MIDHYIDHISGLYLDFAAGLAELLDRNQTFRLGAKIYNDFSSRDLEYLTLKDFPLRWGYEMAVVVEEVFVVLRIDLQGRLPLPAVLIDGHGQTPESLIS